MSTASLAVGDGTGFPRPGPAAAPANQTQKGPSPPRASVAWPGLGQLGPWPASKVTGGGGRLGLVET